MPVRQEVMYYYVCEQKLKKVLIPSDVKSGNTLLQVEESFTESALDSALWNVDLEPGYEFNIKLNVRDDVKGKDTREYQYFQKGSGSHCLTIAQGMFDDCLTAA